MTFIGPIPWGHSGPLCHALSLSSSLSSLASWTTMRRRGATVQWRHLVNWREAARCGEWAQHFSNASCVNSIQCCTESTVRCVMNSVFFSYGINHPSTIVFKWSHTVRPLHRLIPQIDMLQTSTTSRCIKENTNFRNLPLRRVTVFSAKCNIYISRLCYDVSVRLSVRLSVTEVHWRIIANLGFKFRSKFTAQAHNPLALRVAVHAGALWSRWMPGRGEGSSRAMLATARPSCFDVRGCGLQRGLNYMIVTITSGDIRTLRQV